MQPKSQESSSFPCTISIIFILIFNIFITKTLCSDQYHEACAAQSCGNLSSIRYPYWISNKQEPYCGHPSFSILCRNNRNPIFKISDIDYVITSIDYTNHTLHLVNAQVYDDNISCPTPLHNMTLDHTPFNLSTDSAKFFLFYNCLNLPRQYPVYFPINCSFAGNTTSNATNMSFGDFHTEAFAKLNYSLSLCNSVDAVPVDVDVDVDVDQGYTGDSYWTMNYKEILRQGFTLSWSVRDCSDCERSGGRCGLDDNQFVCLNKKRLSKNVIVIGAGVAAAVSAMLLSILCFVYQRRIKKHQHSERFLDQNKSSTPSSATLDLTASTYFGVHVFSYKELEEATDHFNPSKELGEGGFGTVYYGILQDGREVAIKRLYENNSKRAEQFLNEVEILAQLRHKNLVNLYGCTSRLSRELLLVYEYVSNGTVADHLHGKQAKSGLPTWQRRLNIAIETASALVYLHASDIIHRDVKTQNILLDKDFSVKVADFGLSRLFPLDVTHVSTAPQGTPGYVDPEYHQCYQLTERSDVYSFGVVLAELISSKAAVDITRRRADINLSNMARNKIQNDALHEFVDQSLGFQAEFKVTKEITAVAELAFQCLQSTREMRPSMEQVLERLYNIQDHGGRVDRAEVLDIPADDVFMLKGDFSPTSPPRDNNSVRRHIPNASV